MIHDDNKDDTLTPNAAEKQPIRDRPGTTQRAPKVDFTGFENDKDFQRLLVRFPLLKVQLQTVYGLTLEPGPDEARSWYRQPLPGAETPRPHVREARDRRGVRARGRGRGSRGGGRDKYEATAAQDERQRGQWTQEKGDKEARSVIKNMRESTTEHDDQSEGMREFVELCRIRFGDSSA